MMFDQTIEQRLVHCPPHQPEFQRSQIFQTGFDDGSIDIGNTRTLAMKEWIMRSDFDRW